MYSRSPAAPPPEDALARVAARYAVAITPAMEALIDPQDPLDPIALQFRPDARELITLADEHPDPIGDRAHAPLEGIVHRYPDRCLLKLVHVCAVYCRYCFRREMVGPTGDGMLGSAELDAAIGYIAGPPRNLGSGAHGRRPLRAVAAASRRGHGAPRRDTRT